MTLTLNIRCHSSNTSAGDAIDDQRGSESSWLVVASCVRRVGRLRAGVNYPYARRRTHFPRTADAARHLYASLAGRLCARPSKEDFCCQQWGREGGVARFWLATSARPRYTPSLASTHPGCLAGFFSARSSYLNSEFILRRGGNRGRNGLVNAGLKRPFFHGI